jgi:hypothetical protein
MKSEAAYVCISGSFCHGAGFWLSMSLWRACTLGRFVYPEEPEMTVLAAIRKDYITNGALQKIAAARPDQISRPTLRTTVCSLC